MGRTKNKLENPSITFNKKNSSEKTIYLDERHRGQKTKIHSGAQRELQNPDVVYMLGGTPRYIHSTKKYFETGLDTAYKEMSFLLNNVFQRRKQVLNAYAQQIDARWKDFFKFLGIPNLEFTEFKKIWDNKTGDIFSIIKEVESYKDAVSKEAVFTKKQHLLREKARKEIKKLDPQQDLTDPSIVEKLNETIMKDTGLKIEKIDRTGKFSWNGDLIEKSKEWSKVIKNFNEKYINLINKNINKSAYKKIKSSEISKQKTRIENQYKKKIETIKNSMLSQREKNEKIQILEQKKEAEKESVDSISRISPTNTGVLFETEFDTAGKEVILEDDTIGQLFMLNERIGDQQAASRSETTSDIISSLKRIEKDLNGRNIELKFKLFISDKASGSVDFGKEEQLTDEQLLNNNTWYIKPINDQFEAKYQSQVGFSNLDVKGEEQYQSEYEKVVNLFEYVLQNESNFSTSNSKDKQKIKNFKQLVVYYGAWIRLSKAILGNPGNQIAEDTPIGLRTFKGIYNIADLIRFFTQITDAKMIDEFLRKKELHDFYEKKPKRIPIANSRILYDAKYRAIEDSIGDYNKQKSNGDAKITDFISYAEIYDKIKSLLPNFAVKESNLRAINSAFIVKMRNVAIKNSL